MKNPIRIGAALCALILSLSAHAADLPLLHPLFSDGAVLQRDVKLPVWGWTQPGTSVSVSIAKVKGTAVADADGRWQVDLAPSPAGGPHELKVSGPESVTVKNLLFGDVWLCAGQSNMEMGVKAITRGQEEVAAANFPNIRLMTMPVALSARPLPTSTMQWFECKPETIVQTGYHGNGFSGAGYIFGRDLHRDLGVPIGLVAAAAGGTRIEPWSSARALGSIERLKGELAEISKDLRGMPESEWLKKFDPGSAGDAWAQSDFNDSKWENMNVPGRWETGALPNLDGVVWFRRDVDVPASWVGKEAFLDLGVIDDSDTAWVNGQYVGKCDVWDQKRHYKIPAKLLKAGKNTIAVRVVDHSEGGGFFGKPEALQLMQEGGQAAAIPLAGAWRYNVSVRIDDKIKFPDKAGQDGNPNRPTALYNGMIAPLEPFPFKGLFWYQGEANAENAHEYTGFMSNMIADLRQQFRTPNLPVVFVQLPNFQKPWQNPVEDGDWPNLREAQLDVIRKVPHTAMITTIDIGEEADIHPGNKQDIGSRAALAALGTVYKKDIVYSGPIYRKMTVNESKVTLEFDHVGKGLAAKGDGPLKGFAICGADGNFVKAEAKIEGSKITVSSDTVPKPTAVRYNWAINPDGNLVNSAGLPASPFRTDRQ